MIYVRKGKVKFAEIVSEVPIIHCCRWRFKFLHGSNFVTNRNNIHLRFIPSYLLFSVKNTVWRHSELRIDFLHPKLGFRKICLNRDVIVISFVTCFGKIGFKVKRWFSRNMSHSSSSRHHWKRSICWSVMFASSSKSNVRSVFCFDARRVQCSLRSFPFAPGSLHLPGFLLKKVIYRMEFCIIVIRCET